MVFGNKYIKFFLVLLQCCTSMGYGLNIDCIGKAFHCVNATHFKICVDLGGGVSKTVDDFLLPCPENTFCMSTNHYECEYHEITTSTSRSTTTISEFSAITSDLSKVSVIPLLSAENKSETTTVATVQDDAEYKVSSTQEILAAPSTISILKIIENTSNKPAFKSVKDEKLISATLLESNPTDNFESFDFNSVKKHSENRTEHFVMITPIKTNNSSVISEVPNNTSDKNVTLNEPTKGGSVNNTENINSTKLMEQEILFNETKPREKKSKNITSDDFEKVLNKDNFSVEIQINNETTEINIKNTSLNVSTNSGTSEIDVNRVTETTSLIPTLSIIYSSSVEKSIKENSTKANTLNISTENNIFPSYNPISIEKNSLGVYHDSNDIQIITDTKLNINGSETLVSSTVTFNKAFEKENITNIEVTTTSTNIENNNLQAATDRNISDVQLLDNFMNASTYPNIFLNGSNSPFDEEKQMKVSNDSVIHKLSKRLEFEEKSNVNITVKLPTIYEGNNPNSSLSLNSTESPEIIITTTNVAELKDEMKIETNNASQFTNFNYFSVSLNEAEKNSGITEIINDTLATEQSSDINQNINTYPEANIDFFRDSSILNSTTQEPEIKTSNANSESLNQNYIKTLHNSNTSNILELLTTTEYNEVVKENNLKVKELRDNLQKMLKQTETIKYYNKNETNYNMTDFTRKDRISNSNILPDFINASILVSNFENNIIDGPTKEVIKKTFDDENDSDDVITSTTSRISYTNSLHTTTNTDIVPELKDEVLMPYQENSTSLLLTFSSTTKNYIKDTSYTSYIDKHTNIINTSTASHLSFVHTTTESYKEAKTNENYSHETNLKADLTSSINDTKPLSDLLYNSRAYVLHIPKNYNTSSESEALNITTTSSIFHTSSLSSTTERYEATSIALDHLSLTVPRDNVTEMTQNIDGNKWLDTSSSIAVKINTINATNILSGTSIKIDGDRKDNNTDSNINTTYSAHNSSSLLNKTTDYDEISKTTDSLYMTIFEKNIKLPNVTNIYSTKENILITNVSKMNEIQNKTQISLNSKESFSTESIPSVLKNTSIELNREHNETTTHTGQNYSSGNDGVLNRIFSSIQIDNKSNNTTIPINNFQENFNNIFNITLLSFNETIAQRQQDDIDQQKVITNPSKMNKHLLYPLHLILLTKGNYSEAHDDNLETTEVNLKPIHAMDAKVEQKVVQNASLDNISYTHDSTTGTLIKVTEEYNSTTRFVPRLIKHNIDSSIIVTNNTSKAKTNSIYHSVPIQMEMSTTNNESQLNTTESFHYTLPIESERITITDNANLYGTKRNITAKYYNILETDLPLKIAKRDETIDDIIPTRNKNYTISNNASALFEDLLSTPEVPSTLNSAPLFEKDIISTEQIKATTQVSLPKLSSVSVTSEHNNLTINFINKLVTDFYATTSETKSDIKLNSQIKFSNSDTPMHLQITKRTPLSKSDTTLKDDTQFSSDILVSSQSTTRYEYITDAYSPESQLRNIYESSDSTLIDTISENEDSLQDKLSGIAFNDKPRTTQSIKINSGNTVDNHLLTQAPAPALILTDKSHNSFVHNVTGNNLMILPDTIEIRWKDTRNLSTTTVNSKRYSSIKNLNKPITDIKNEELNELKKLKTNTSSLQVVSKSNQNKTKYTDGNLNNSSITTLRNSSNSTSILVTPKVLSFESSINIKIKSTTVKSTINYSNSGSTNVKNASGTLLGAIPFIQSRNYNRTQNVTTSLSKNSVNADDIKLNKCFNQPNGKYADKYDCKKFYICLGDAMPVLGECPNGTVFSESKKQCTKNFSQCYRNNQFTCLTPGRYYDLSIKNVYYICVKNRGKFIKFKYQCQNGYSLNETIVKCIKDNDTSAYNNSDSTNTKEDSTSISVESTSKATLNIKSSKKGDTEFECKKEGKFPHPKMCNQYYLCTKIKKSVFRRKLKTCDSGEVFDKEKNQCADTDSHEC